MIPSKHAGEKELQGSRPPATPGVLSEKAGKQEPIGLIHSIESFGTVDGPGTRYVVFFQGCPMRCKYCHNPDTWPTAGITEVLASPPHMADAPASAASPAQGADSPAAMTVDEVLSGYRRQAAFYRNGGITATGGEPLLQLPFLTALFRQAKAEGIHTCLDTSGILYRAGRQAEYDALFSCTSLVLLDLKHSDPKGHLELTGQEQAPVLAFAAALAERSIPVIVRHVVVPGITYNKKQLTALGRLIGAWGNLAGLEVLPYHTMGAAKYSALGIPCPLADTPALGKEEAAAAKRLILAGIKETRHTH